MRYFLYISDAKVNMLLSQIPSETKAVIEAKLGFNIGLLSGDIKTKRTSLEDKVQRLAAVEKHLLSTQVIGSCDKPEAWIRGEGSAIVAQLLPSGEGRWSNGRGAEAVFFILRTENSLVAMGGSSHHLIGSTSTNQCVSGMSFAPSLLDAFAEISDSPMILQMTEERFKYNSQVGIARTATHPWTRVIIDAAQNLSGASQNISFIAKRLMSEDCYGTTVTLATPLYVEQVD